MASNKRGSSSHQHNGYGGGGGGGGQNQKQNDFATASYEQLVAHPDMAHYCFEVLGRELNEHEHHPEPKFANDE